MTDTTTTTGNAANGDLDDFPQTWDRLTTLPELVNLPRMRKPQELSVSDSILFALMQEKTSQRVNELTELHAFDPDKPTRDPDKAMQLIGETVAYMNAFFHEISIKPADYDKWNQGRTVYQTLNRLIPLTRYYAEQLGKSDESANATSNAPQR